MASNGKVKKTLPAKRQSSRTRSQLDQMAKEAKPAKMAAKPTATASTGSDTTDSDTAGAVVYFWRETEDETGYLSQWYPCDFTDEAGTVYKTAEHYMMYQKALMFDDLATGAKILQGKHPRSVKSLGRQVQNFDEARWLAHRERIVREGNVLKFTRAVDETGLRRAKSDRARPVGGSLRALLLSTGRAELVEASPFDRIWGIGFREKDAETSRQAWGLNLLGKALMEVREQFRKEDESKQDTAE